MNLDGNKRRCVLCGSCHCDVANRGYVASYSVKQNRSRDPETASKEEKEVTHEESPKAV